MREIKSKTHMVDGNKVRSFLESQWMLFFKYLQIDFEYEPERFPDGVTNIGYLPDMLIHGDIYIEIKPTIEIARCERKKPEGFVRETGKKLWVVVGRPPGDRVIQIVKRDDGSIGNRYNRGISWRSLNRLSSYDEYIERKAAAEAVNNVSFTMNSPIARVLENLDREKLKLFGLDKYL